MPTKTDLLTDEIVRRIRLGQLAPGERLPTSNNLAEEFNVSRGTARSVLDRLLGHGLICKRGNSWYVERRNTDR